MDDCWFLEIKDMISKKREDKYWDYKEYHHKNQADLLHDILCMANNTDLFKPSYIIFGVDDDGNVKGVQRGDPNRKNQQKIVNLLKDKKFAEGRRPQVQMRSSLDYEGKLLDVLIIENNLDTPYYLTEDFKNKSKNTNEIPSRIVKAHHVYTRVNDTNVDIDKSADPHIVEKLWKKRFGLLLPPILMFRALLETKQDWRLVENAYYHSYHPEYTIELDYDQKEPVAEKFKPYTSLPSPVVPPTRMPYVFPSLPPAGMMRIKYSGTTLFSRRFSGKIKEKITFNPEHGTIRFIPDGKNINYNYFLKNSLILSIYHFLNTNKDQAESHLSRFIFFESEEEQHAFTIYAQEKFSKFTELGGEYTPGNLISNASKDALKSFLQEYRAMTENKI